MILPAPIPYLVLALMASNWPGTVQTYQDALQVLREISPQQFENSSEDGPMPADFIATSDHGDEPDPDISNLWSDISDAFRFLEERPLETSADRKLLEEELKRLQTKDMSKRLPFNQHNFIRFGKREMPNGEEIPFVNSEESQGKRMLHNFVRIGKRTDPSKASPWEKIMEPKTETRPEKDQGRTPFDWSKPVPLPAQTYQRRRGQVGNVMSRINSAWQDFLKKRQSKFVRIGRSYRLEGEPTGLTSEQDENISRNRFPQSLRFVRSVQDNHNMEPPSRPKRSVSQDGNHLSTEPLPSNAVRNSDIAKAVDGWEPVVKRFETARIGRIPATVFYLPRQEHEASSAKSVQLFPRMLVRSSPSGLQHLHNLPRYG